PGDVEVRTAPREGYSVAEDGGYLVAVTTTLTPELELEGHARELVRRIQQLRKDAGLDISDRIVLTVTHTPLVDGVLDEHGDYVAEETLTVRIMRVDTETGLPLSKQGRASDHFTLGEDKVTISLERA